MPPASTVCSIPLCPPHPATPGIISMEMATVPGRPRVYFYNTMDIVSDWLKQGRVWEKEELDEVFWAMEHPVPGETLGSSGAGSGQGDKLFVDIGANLGWFSVNMAARGYQVAAFEGAAIRVCVEV